MSKRDCKKVLDEWALTKDYIDWHSFCEGNDGHLSEKEAFDLAAFCISKTLDWAIAEVGSK